MLLSYNSWESVMILPNSPLLLTESWQSIFLPSHLLWNNTMFLRKEIAAGHQVMENPRAVLLSVLPLNLSIANNHKLRPSQRVKLAFSSTRHYSQRGSQYRPTVNWLSMQQFSLISFSVGNPGEIQKSVHVGRTMLFMSSNFIEWEESHCACRWHNEGKSNCQTQHSPYLCSQLSLAYAGYTLQTHQMPIYIRRKKKKNHQFCDSVILIRIDYCLFLSSRYL